MGDATSAAGRRSGVQEVLADETTNEARGSAENQSAGKRSRFDTGGLSAEGFDTVLIVWAERWILEGFSNESNSGSAVESA